MTSEATERTPLVVNTDISSNNIGNGESHPKTPTSPGMGEFSFKKTTRRDKFFLVLMSFVNFCAAACFSLLAPFFPKEVRWAASSEFGTYRLCEQRRFRRACASAQSRQNLRCSLIQAESQEEPSDRKPDPWPLWMAGHAQLKFDMTECSKTQIRLTRHR